MVEITLPNLSQVPNLTDEKCYARLHRINEDDYTQPVPLFLFSIVPNPYVPSVAPDPVAAAATSGAPSRKRPCNEGMSFCLFICLRDGHDAIQVFVTLD